MLTDHLRTVMERLGRLPESVQERFAAEIEVDLDQEIAHKGSAEQADDREQVEQETFAGYPLGVNPLEKYIGRLEDRFPHLSDDEVLAMEAAASYTH